MADQPTRNNHYVAQWYQQGFLKPGSSHLRYLDLDPPKATKSDGSPVVWRPMKHGVKKAFCNYDLYTTTFGPIVNDEVERMLFGQIDNDGATAVRALIDNDPLAMRDSFEDLFAYFDAQKLRTPKGLDWIKSRYAELDQVHLMGEMQGLRLMHCRMWTEGAREIVSAKGSGAKFIVTDHPVTFYNAATPPTHARCAYPSDPAFDWIGTITVFPLNDENCVILSHLEYANDPGTERLMAQRTNARYRGRSFVKPDAWIRKRSLSRDEVVAINHLLKSRARRYIASSSDEWLYPEKEFKGEWPDLAPILLPRDERWKFGGEMYMKYNDGRIDYQDEFGRSSKSHEYLKREKLEKPVGPGDPCGCGSGRAFEQCCRDIPEDKRPASWALLSIRERNIMLINAIKDVLKLGRNGATWNDVQRTLTDAQVKEIHEVFAALWPQDADIVGLLPRPNSNFARGVYLGGADPHSVGAVVDAWMPYFDEVVIAHPFPAIWGVKPEFSPVEHPENFKRLSLRNFAFMLGLEPFIRSGRVHVVPIDLDAEFSRDVMGLAEARAAGWEMDSTTKGRIERMVQVERKRMFAQLPESALESFIKRELPDIPPDMLPRVIRRIKDEVADDPFALLQDLPAGPAGAQLLAFKGFNLETSLFLASLVGGFIFTELDLHWYQLHEHATRPSSSQEDGLTEAVKHFEKPNLPIEVDPEIVYEHVKISRFSALPVALRALSAAASTDRQPSALLGLLENLPNAINAEWNGVREHHRLNGQIRISAPVGGFERDEVRRLLLTFGRAEATSRVPFAVFQKFRPTDDDQGE